MNADEKRALRHLMMLAHNDLLFDLDLMTLWSTLRETYGLAKLLRMLEEHLTK